MTAVTLLRPLAEAELTIYDAFEKPDTDVPIELLHGLLYPGMYRTAKQQQQYVGAVISRINAKLRSVKIKPGAIKRTYRLSKA